MLIGAKKLAALSGMCAPRRIGLLGRIVCADMRLHALYVNARDVTSSVFRWSHSTRKYTAAWATVPAVLLRSCGSEISPSVIVLITIDVVSPDRPFASHHFNDQSMGQKIASIKLNLDIAGRRSRKFSCVLRVQSALCQFALEMMKRSLLPYQHARLGIVDKALVQIGLRRLILSFSHGALLSRLSVRGAAALARAPRLACYNMGAIP